MSALLSAWPLCASQSLSESDLDRSAVSGKQGSELEETRALMFKMTVHAFRLKLWRLERTQKHNRHYETASRE